MNKLKQIDGMRQNTIDRNHMNSTMSDPFMYKGGVPDINCLACDQNISVSKIEQMLDDKKNSHKRLSP